MLFEHGGTEVCTRGRLFELAVTAELWLIICVGRTHLRRKHIRAKSCHICGARFGTDRELNRHLESERRCQSPAEPVASVYDDDLAHEQFLLEHPGVKWRDLYIGMLGVPPNMDMESE